MPASDPPKSKKQKTAPTAVGDFAVLPLTLLPLPGLPPSCAYAKHYLYVKAHTPSIPTETADRSLFLANVPADASESNIRLLFAEQLGGARVESVDFDSAIPAGVQHKRFKAEEAAKGGAEEEAAAAPARGKKRKRGGAGEMLAEGVRDDAESALPSTWGSELRKSGGCAVVVFVDRTSFRGAWKEVARASKEGVQLEWKGGENLGAQRRFFFFYQHPNSVLWIFFFLFGLVWDVLATDFGILQAIKRISSSFIPRPRSYNPRQTLSSRSSTLSKHSATGVSRTSARSPTKTASSPSRAAEDATRLLLGSRLRSRSRRSWRSGRRRRAPWMGSTGSSIARRGKKRRDA